VGRVGERGPIGRGQGHRTRRLVALRSGGPAGTAPAPPPGWLKATRQAWDAYWRSDVARAVAEVDLAAVERYFAYLDEWRRAMRGYRAQRLTRGSTGQVVVHPLAGQVARLETMLARLERELGLTPMARARLGVTIGEAARSLEELLDDDDDDDPGAGRGAVDTGT
jgi:P27 family predicted phage terminase small subunit